VTATIQALASPSSSPSDVRGSDIPWSRRLTAERYPEPLSPLGWSNLGKVFDGGVREFAQFMGMPIASTEELAREMDGWIVANSRAFDFRTRFKLRLRGNELATLLSIVISHWWVTPGKLRTIRGMVRWVRRPELARTKLGNHRDGLETVMAATAIDLYLSRVAADIRESWPTTLLRFRSTVERITTRIAATDSPAELLALGDALTEAMLAYTQPDLVIFAVKEIAALALKDLATLAGLPDPESVPSRLGLGLSSNITLITQRRLHDLARRVVHAGYPEHPGQSPADLPSGLRHAVEQFLEECGHLTCSWDIARPTWGEDPPGFLALLPIFARIQPRETGEGDPKQQAQNLTNRMSAVPPCRPERCLHTEGRRSEKGSTLSQGLAPPPFAPADGRAGSFLCAEGVRAVADCTLADLLERLPTSGPLPSVARRLTALLREFMMLDEEHHFHTGRIIPVTRRLVLRLGNDLTARGCLNGPEDIFYLTDPEVRELFAQGRYPDMRTLVGNRRLAQAEALRRGPPDLPADRSEHAPAHDSAPPHPGPDSPEKVVPAKATDPSNLNPAAPADEFPRSPLNDPESPSAAPALSWQGLGVSPGKARGPARQVRTPSDLAAVQPGDILVVRSPDPFFVVVYGTIAGLVAETGSPLSHGAVAARECRVPAVFGLKRAWHLFPDGTPIELDGRHGTVTHRTDPCRDRKNTVE
jgi:phosphohistidine swiveling domain-containing protein